MKWYIEPSEFEMLIQLDDDGIEELKEMIDMNDLKLRISINNLKTDMSDEQLIENSTSGISLNYFSPDDLVNENGVKAEILENNQVKINVSPFIFKFTPKSDLASEIESQLIDSDTLYQIGFDFPYGGGEVISSNLRSTTRKYMAPDYSSDEDPRPEKEYTSTTYYGRVYPIPEKNYKNADDEFNGSIRKMLENT
tara:strand:- start:1135 stop:1719 length:585 start_codon:yes stop_codon:yes gene_type:complete